MNQQLSFLLAQSNDIFCAFDKNGNIIMANAAFSHFTGYNETEIDSKNIIELSHPDDRDRNIELLRNIISGKNITDYLIKIKARSGIFLDVVWSLSFDAEDGLNYAIGLYTDEKLNIRNPHHISGKLQHVLANLADGFFMLDKNWCINAFNQAFHHIMNIPADDLHGADFRQLTNLTDEVIPQFENAFKHNKASEVQYYDQHYRGWLKLNIYPYKNEVIVFIRDITNVKVQQSILALEKKVLELHLMAAHPLPRIADELLIGIQAIFPEMYCSILEIDSAQEKVYHLSAPSLPDEYCQIINGLKIGPQAGSCGTAAFHREQIIVSDIEHDPLWEDYKQYILPHGFKACWSTPVIGSQNNSVLATFAIYYNTIREPKTEELQMIERTINILRVLIESKKSNARMAEQNKRLQDIASISSHDIRRPVATILGLVNLFDKNKLNSPLNKEIIEHLETTSQELDDVIHIIVEKTINI